MREINYFIPENREELENIIGEPVGVFNGYPEIGIYEKFSIKLYEGYDGWGCSFINQGMSEDRAQESINSLSCLLEDLRVTPQGLYVFQCPSLLKEISPSDSEYNPKRELLLSKNMWVEPLQIGA